MRTNGMIPKGLKNGSIETTAIYLCVADEEAYPHREADVAEFPILHTMSPEGETGARPFSFAMRIIAPISIC